jgi:hypothetical protein
MGRVILFGVAGFLFNAAVIVGLLWILSRGATFGGTHYSFEWNESTGLELLERKVR